MATARAPLASFHSTVIILKYSKQLTFQGNFTTLNPSKLPNLIPAPIKMASSARTFWTFPRKRKKRLVNCRERFRFHLLFPPIALSPLFLSRRSTKGNGRKTRKNFVFAEGTFSDPNCAADAR